MWTTPSNSAISSRLQTQWPGLVIGYLNSCYVTLTFQQKWYQKVWNPRIFWGHAPRSPSQVGLTHSFLLDWSTNLKLFNDNFKLSIRLSISVCVGFLKGGFQYAPYYQCTRYSVIKYMKHAWPQLARYEWQWQFEIEIILVMFVGIR